MKKFTVGLLTISLALVAGCSKGFKVTEEKDTSTPIIKVNESVITQKKFDKTLENVYNTSILAARNINLKEEKNKPLYTLIKGKIVNELIIKELIQQEAQKRKISVTQKELDKAIDELAQKVGGKAKLEATLTLQNVSKETFVEGIKMDLTTKKLLESLTAKAEISDKEAKDFYEKNKTTKFTLPDMVNAQHILIASTESDIKAKLQSEKSNLSESELNKKAQEEMNKAKSKAENILAKLKANPALFADLAKSSSDDASSAEKGGDLGYFKKGDMVPAFSKVAFSLAPGQISDIVKTDFGYHIIKVSDRKKAGIVPFVEIKEEIKKFMINKSKTSLMEKLIQNAKNTAKIVYLSDEYNLDKIQKEIEDIKKKAPKKQ
ncbi:MAG: hypothetical protein A2287_07055 [Candidatus Melainabacteria bacterium RIFOXYA12_FULL_32_12]|nr:MAG: hypothetical protein A2287_07055 [Candidatus Melainabacteria bacterium RIFOXYA12_FULL_32_12]OGV06971.1 MAG: hypothetical protein A2299_17350 [Stygiobacter sp. RIFOXYB2_FULL_37_11]